MLQSVTRSITLEERRTEASKAAVLGCGTPTNTRGDKKQSSQPHLPLNELALGSGLVPLHQAGGVTAAETSNRWRVETAQRQSHQPVEETLKETKELGVCACRWKEEEILLGEEDSQQTVRKTAQGSVPGDSLKDARGLGCKTVCGKPS